MRKWGGGGGGGGGGISRQTREESGADRGGQRKIR